MPDFTRDNPVVRYCCCTATITNKSQIQYVDEGPIFAQGTWKFDICCSAAASSIAVCLYRRAGAVSLHYPLGLETITVIMTKVTMIITVSNVLVMSAAAALSATTATVQVWSKQHAQNTSL